VPVKSLKLADLKPQNFIQPRVRADEFTIRDYAKAIGDGATFPPGEAFDDGKEIWIADGNLRATAHVLAGKTHMRFNVRKGARKDAVLFAVGANVQHGLRRTNADKKNAVMMLLSDATFAKLSDREIARRCAVTHPFIASVRAELKGGNGFHAEPRESLVLSDEARELIADSPLADPSRVAIQQLANIRREDQAAVAKAMIENPGTTASQARRLIRRAAGNGGIVARRLISPRAASEDCEFIVGDFIKASQKLPRGKFHLAVFDPPYNLKFRYQDDPTRDDLSPKDYARMIRYAVEIARDLLTADGTLCMIICEEHVDLFGQIIRAAGFHVRRLIVWFESFGQAGNGNFGRTCRFIWYATKSKDKFVFDESALLTTARREYIYKDKRVMPGGKVCDSLWDDIPRVCGTYNESMHDKGAPTQLPEKLVARCVAGFTEPGDSVIDFFGGTGTTARAALSLGRKCVLIDRSKKYMDMARRSINEMTAKPEAA
jgi:DNA modification methylase